MKRLAERLAPALGELKKEEENRLKEINFVRIEQERKSKEEQVERERIGPSYRTRS